jgi:chaperonin GroES
MKYIQAIKDKVVVELVTPEKVTQGGIVIPECAADNSPHKAGVVVSVGKDVLEEVKVGETVIFAKFAGQDTILDNKIYKILMYGEIYGIIREG